MHSTRPRDVLPYVVVEAEAALEKVPMRLSVYHCTLSAEPARAAEIAAIRWTSGRDQHVARLAPATGTSWRLGSCPTVCWPPLARARCSGSPG